MASTTHNKLEDELAMSPCLALVITDPALADENPVEDDAAIASEQVEQALDHICYSENGRGCCTHARFDYAASGGRCDGGINRGAGGNPYADGNERNITPADAHTVDDSPK